MPTPQRTAVHVLWKSPHPSNPGMTTASRGAIGRDARKKAPARSPIRSRADAVSRRERNLERRSKNASIILDRTGCGRARDRKILRGHPRKTGRTRSVTHERPWCWSSSVVRHGTLRFQAGRVGTAPPSRRPNFGSEAPQRECGLLASACLWGRPVRPPAWGHGPRRPGRAPPVGVQDVAKPMSPSPPLSSLSRSRSWCPFMVRTWTSWLSGLSRAGRPP